MKNKIFQAVWSPVGKLTPAQVEAKENLMNDMKCSYKLEKYDCICGSSEFEKLISKDIMGLPAFIVICRKCGLVMQNPRMDTKSLHHFYTTHYHNLYPYTQGENDEYELMVKRGRLIHDYVTEKVPDFDDSPRRILEVGCNKGGIISYFLQTGGGAAFMYWDRFKSESCRIC